MNSGALSSLSRTASTTSRVCKPCPETARVALPFVALSSSAARTCTIFGVAQSFASKLSAVGSSETDSSPVTAIDTVTPDGGGCVSETDSSADCPSLTSANGERTSE